MNDGLIDFGKRASIAGGIALLLAVLVFGAGYAFDVLMLAFAGLLFALLLRSITDFVHQRTGMGDNLAVAVAVLLVVGAFVGFGLYLVPQVAEQGVELRKTLPKSLERLTTELKKYEATQWFLEQAPEASDLIPRRRDLISQITGIFSTALSVVGAVVVVFFIGIYLALDPGMYTEGIIRLVPVEKRGRAGQILGKLGTALKWWLMGQLVAMVFVGVLVWLGLMLLGLPFALTLGVIAALLTFIPNFGPVISAIPAVLIGLMESPLTAGWVVVLFIAVQTVESYMLTPMIQQSVIALPAVLTITAQLMLGVYFGGIGLALATPLVLVILVLVQSIYVQDLLGDWTKNGPAAT